MHGWGGNAELMLPVAAPLNAAGFALLLVDARCHGLGATATASPRCRALPKTSKPPWPGWPSSRKPTATAGRARPLGRRRCGPARRQPPARLAGGGQHRRLCPPGADDAPLAGAKRIPYRPFGALILAYVQRTIGWRFDAIAPVNTTARAHCPVLLLHGDRDDLVPYAEAEEIHAARGEAKVELACIPGSHDDYGDAAEAAGIAVGFLRKCLTD